MNRICVAFLGALGLILFSLPALADTSPNFTWTGFYAGVNGGGSVGRTYWQYQTGGSTQSHDTTGGVVGGMAGYNMQTDKWVYGVEGDMDYTTIWGDDSCPTTVYRCQSNVRGLATLRARGGYELNGVIPGVNHLLPYLTAGPALGTLRIDTVSTTASAGSTTKTVPGWTIGAGAEYPITDNITTRAEYMYYDLIKENYTVDSNLTVHANNWGSIIRIGFAYKFTD